MKPVLRSLAIALVLLCASRALCDEQSTQREYFDMVVLTKSRPILVRLHVYVKDKLLADTWDQRAREVFEFLDRDHDAQLLGNELQHLEEIFGITPPPPGNRTLIGDVVRFLGNIKTPWSKYPPVDFENFMGLWKEQHLLIATTEEAMPLPKSKDILSTLDADHSGTLSLDELGAAREVLKRWDVNEDELITTVDLNQFLNPLNYEYAQSYQLEDFSSVIAVLGTDDLCSYAVHQMLVVYQLRDGEIPLTSWGFPEGRLLPFDKDQNERLSIQELKFFLQSFQPDLELDVHVDPKDGSTTISWQQLNQLGSERFVALSESKQAIALEIGDTRLKLLGSVATGTYYAEYYGASFQQSDTDMNGYLEKKELSEANFTLSIYEVADADGDGKLFKKEFNSYINQVYGQAERQVTINVTDKGKSFYNSLDRNADDRLSIREQIEGAQAGALYWDRNSDGIIAVDELPRSYVMTISVGVENGEPDAAVETTAVSENDNGNWFQRLDRNSDGDVSRREFPGPIEVFEKLDADGDGLLSSSEAAVAY